MKIKIFFALVLLSTSPFLAKTATAQITLGNQNIPPYIVIKTPNGAAVNWVPGVKYKVSWKSSGIQNVGIAFCYNNYPYTGTPNCHSGPFSGTTMIFPASPGHAFIVIPNPWPGNEQTVTGKIRVYDANNPSTIYSESSVRVTITSSNFPG